MRKRGRRNERKIEIGRERKERDREERSRRGMGCEARIALRLS